MLNFFFRVGFYIGYFLILAVKAPYRLLRVRRGN